LSDRYSLPFHWIEWPLRPHPTTLDRLFRSIQSEAVLLIDSDIEIRSARVVSAMQAALRQHADAYGAGFVQGPEWLGKEHGLPDYTGYYEERMWIPLVLLRTAPIKKLLEQGYTFSNRRPYLDFPAWPRFSRLLAYRYRLQGLRQLPIRFTRPRTGEPRYDGRTPAFVEYDTGADLHAKLKRSAHAFVQVSPELWGEVSHYHGVTRAQLTGTLRRIAKSMRLASRDTETDQRAILAAVMQRLASVYGVDALVDGH
jgi:hypothetical protein